MRTVGARLQNVAPGQVEIDLPFRDDLTQHHGYVAAAVLTAIVDVACGYAAMTLMPRIGVDDRVQGELSFAGSGRANGRSWEGCQARADRERVLGRCCCDSGDNERIVATMLSTTATIGRTREAFQTDRET